jgi:hypothetical protein
MREITRWAIGGLLLVTACAVPQYDEDAAKSASDLQKNIDVKFYSWESLLRQRNRPGISKDQIQKLDNQLSYDQNSQFYSQSYADLATLQTQLAGAETEPKSQASIDGWFNYIQKVLSDTEQEHEENLLTAPTLDQHVREINGTFRSISTYIQVTKPTTKK